MSRGQAGPPARAWSEVLTLRRCWKGKYSSKPPIPAPGRTLTPQLGPSCAPAVLLSSARQLSALAPCRVVDAIGSVLGHLPSPQHPCLSCSVAPAHFVLPWARPPRLSHGWTRRPPPQPRLSPSELSSMLQPTARPGRVPPRLTACGSCPSCLAGLTSLA